MFSSYNDLTVGNFFDRQLKKYPEKVIQVFEDGRRQTYAQLNNRANRLANALLRLGLKKGDFIAFYSTNSMEHMEFLLAAARIGIVAVFLNCFMPKERVIPMLEIAGARAIIYEDQFEESIQFFKEKGENRSVHYIGIRRGEGQRGIDGIDYNRLIEDAPDRHPGTGVRASDPYILLFTTGTTGEPKGVLKSMAGLYFHVLSNNFYAAYNVAAQRLGNAAYTNLRHLVVPPLFHIGPLVYPMYAFMMQRSMVIMRKFDPERFLWLIDHESVNGVWIQPAMLYRMKQLPPNILSKYNRSSIVVIICGGGPIKMAEVEDMMEFFPNATFSSNYGSTETGSAAVVTGEELRRTNEKNLGLPSLGADLKIEDDQGNELPAGKEGRIWITCPGMPIGCEYYKNPAKTKEGFKNGWVFLGDLGYQDDRGYTYYTGREIDFIKSGGEKISPLPIQSVLLTLDGVLAAEVIGVPDKQWGEAVKAVVIRNPGTHVSEEEIIRQCKGRLAKYEVPKSVDFVDQFPVGPTGKVLRSELKARYAGRSAGGPKEG